MQKQLCDVHGILLLDKPRGITSNHALQRVKRLFSAKKAGHTGSLDPLATGMLPLCLGEATKFSQFLLNSDKYYRVVAKLGVQTTTADSEGEIVAVSSVEGINLSNLMRVLPGFMGVIEQVPPMYSALKYHGKPLYRLARQGIEVERQPREVCIHVLQAEELCGDLLSLYVHCSKGTYIRTLVEDIGRELGCGAHVYQLRRMAVSPYQQATMYSMSILESIHEEAGMQGLSALLLPMESAVDVFPAVKLSTAAAFYLRMGQAVRVPELPSTGLIRLLSVDAKFLGIGEVLADGRVKPHRLVA
ncbi:MAG: tRNA pseudouridine(55) synthase TruB [Gammaproteobacteria bacterium RIFCSPHIGHO2_12_FULL_41_20]|nr:MAG: tRNA pseudouridine(55) synthase TruB [Gammaproteobacteria bacterium RIFCSPHIGHO2_12_FULL_41_20]